MTEDQPQRRSNKKMVWVIVLAVVLHIGGLMCCCGGFGLWTLWSFRELPAVQASASQFLQTLARGDIDGAYRSTSPTFQDATTLAQFHAFVNKYPVLHSQNGTQLRYAQLAGASSGKKAIVGAVATNNNISISCTIGLAKEGEVWKVERFTVP
ncbi:hypothetical protein BH10PLA2_BH10PLA2_18480 [soil metagenome]